MPSLTSRAKEAVKALIKRSPVPLSQNHRYDLQTRRILKQVLRPDSHCVDVGCHKGEILTLMRAAAPLGKHHGFEPIPVLASDLAAAFAKTPGVLIHQLALSDHEGEADFNYVVSNPSYSGLVRRDYDRAGERDTSIRVRTARLDDVLDPEEPIALIKIDVEGGELQVLRGARRTLARWRPLVIFEHGLGASEHYGTTPEAVFAVLAEAGLSVYTLDAFLSQGARLDQVAFGRCFRERREYYFVASA